MYYDPFTEPAKPRKIENVSVGQKIKVVEQLGLPDNRKVVVSYEYVVTDIYPYCVQARRRTDTRIETRCFSVGDLVTLGLMPKWR